MDSRGNIMEVLVTIAQSTADAGSRPELASTALHVIVYRSRSAIAPAGEDAELSRILRDARAKNAGLGVTGALMLYDGWFAQVLEGPQAAVSGLFDRIKSDSRHSGVVVLQSGPAEKRAFDRWAMALVGEHGEPDIPLMASKDGVVAGGAWRTNEAQEDLLAILRKFTRGYGRGS